MKTRIKTLTILAVIAGATLAVQAEEQQAPNAPARKPAEFKCPVCGSPCVNKAELIKQRRRQMQGNAAQRMRPAREATEATAAAPARTQQPRQRNPEMAQRVRQQAQRFDIDGNGKLSPAERAALRAYRAAMQAERGQRPEQPAPEQIGE